MSVWIMLNDIRVRCDRGDGDPYDVIRCLTNLYDVPHKGMIDYNPYTGEELAGELTDLEQFEMDNTEEIPK